MKDPNQSMTNAPTPESKSRRRTIDAVALAVFHLALVAVVAYSRRGLLEITPLFALLVLGLDATYFFSPPKRRAILDPIPGTEPMVRVRLRDYWLELLVLLGPPLALMGWFQCLIWMHRTLTTVELIAVVAAMPVVVLVVTQIIKYRLTHRFKGVKNKATQFIAMTMLATWIGATFLFVLLAMCLLFRSR